MPELALNAHAFAVLALTVVAFVLFAVERIPIPVTGLLFTIPNTIFILEYSRVDPYVFSHSRSRENDYGSFGSLLGARIGPNADSWLVRVDVLPHRNFTLSARVAIERHGENLDSLGLLPKNGNFGGDFLQPHRESDPATKVWLGGIMFKTYRAQVLGSYEIMRQAWCDLSFEYELDKNITAGTQSKISRWLPGSAWNFSRSHLNSR